METIDENVFIFILDAIVKVSPDSLRIAYKEKDKSPSLDDEAGHFLKLNEERIGMDIEKYILMSKKFIFYGLPDFFIVLLKIKADCPDAYRVGSKILKKVGQKVFDGKILSNWNKMFK